MANEALALVALANGRGEMTDTDSAAEEIEVVVDLDDDDESEIPIDQRKSGLSSPPPRQKQTPTEKKAVHAKWCCAVPPHLGGDPVCTLVAHHENDHEYPQGGTRTQPEPGQRVPRTVPPLVIKSPASIAEEVLVAPSKRKVSAVVEGWLKEYEDTMSALGRSNKDVCRIVDQLKIAWKPSKTSGQFHLTLPNGREIQGKGAIMEALRVRMTHFNDYEVAQRMQHGLHTIIGELEATDPIMKRTLMIAGTNVQKEEHYTAAPLIATPDGGKTFDQMSDAELKSVLAQAQLEDTEREVKKRVALVVDEARAALRTEESRVKRKRDEVEALRGEVEKTKAEAEKERDLLKEQRQKVQDFAKSFAV